MDGTIIVKADRITQPSPGSFSILLRCVKGNIQFLLTERDAASHIADKQRNLIRLQLITSFKRMSHVRLPERYGHVHIDNDIIVQGT